MENTGYIHDVNDVKLYTIGSGNGKEKETQVQHGKQGNAGNDRYGCLGIKPGFLQPLNRMSVFVACTVFMCFVEGYAVNGIANAGRPHIEKQFGLKSSTSALITSAQDIGALSVVLFVSYIGNSPKFNKARWVAVGSALMGLGSLVFIIPHFILRAGDGGIGPPPSAICDLTNSSSSGPGENKNADRQAYLGVFMVANILHGIGFSPMFTVGTVYIDENEKPSLAAIYVGLTYAAAALGVGFGFFVGGVFMENYYVDFDTVNQDSLGFDSEDSPWVGAWWLGFVPSVLAFFLVAIPIFGFPKRLPGRPESSAVEISQKCASNDGDTSVKTKVVAVFKRIFQLVRNPPFIFLSLGGATEALIISGVGAFAFKFLAEQYDMSFDSAGYLLGGLILFSAFGMAMGGVLIKCFKLEARGMARLNALMTLLTAAMGASLLAGCPNVNLAGLEVSYPNESSINGWTATCQDLCTCDLSTFNPVCGTDGRVYYSPCHAGCTGIIEPGPSESYSNCSCLADHHNTSLADHLTIVEKGRCTSGCWGLYVVAPFMFVMLFAVLITTTPTSMATLRVVDPDNKSFGLGIQWVLLRLLGMIPGPPLVGWVLDETCLIWQTAPDGTTYCALYDKEAMSTGLTTWWVIVNILATIFFFMASLCGVRKRDSS